MFVYHFLSIGIYSVSECIVGHYGADCNSICEHCNKSSDGCQQSDGHCLHGCENNHWKKPKCEGLFLTGRGFQQVCFPQVSLVRGFQQM